MKHRTHENLSLNDLAMSSTERPRVLLVVSFLAILASIALSETFFPNLGPPPERLNSPIEAQRWLARVTLFEIAFLRGLLVTVSVLSALTWLKWEDLSNSRFVAKVYARSAYPLTDDGVLNRSFKIMFSASIFMLCLTALGSVYPILLPEVVLIEDGLVEYITALLFVLCSIIAFFLATRETVPMRKLVLYLMAIFFFLCFGEELSWGQRVFDYATPDALLAKNVQGEANFHNSFGYAVDHLFRASVVTYCILIPVLAYRYDFIHRLVDYTGLPIGSLGLAAGFFIASLHENALIYRILPETDLRQAEVRELLCSIGFLLLMLETRKLQARLASRRNIEQ